MRSWPWLSGALCATAAAAVGLVLGSGSTTRASDRPSNQFAVPNANGVNVTLTTAGSFDLANPFLQDIGTNGRSCVTCHQPTDAWTVTPAGLQRRFNRTQGFDPIFRTNDGSTCEGADVSTLPKRRRAFSMLLRKGVIRVGMAVPPNAEFAIIDVDDPYHCGMPLTEASMFRRILPSTNLKFLSAVMWDGRETVAGRSIRSDLLTQASHATTTHAQGATPSRGQLAQIVDFELALFTAQAYDWRAGSLTRAGARGGPGAIVSQPFCIGINDPLHMLPSMPGACASAPSSFDPQVFTPFKSWERASLPARRAIARGERIFNTRTFAIDDVGGLNRGSQDPVKGSITGTCTLCHDTPNVGDHSVSMALDIGVASADRRTPDLPLYTLQNLTTGDTVQTTDPGRAMVTGKWADVGKFKGPILRALAARAPYFHNGSAATLEDLVEFYNTRFHIGLAPREKADLVAFLGAL
jgi:hypothetical protein